MGFEMFWAFFIFGGEVVLKYHNIWTSRSYLYHYTSVSLFRKEKKKNFGYRRSMVCAPLSHP